MKILGKVQVFNGFYEVIRGVEKWRFFEGKSREFDEMRSFLGGDKKGVIGVSKRRAGRCLASGFRGFPGFSGKMGKNRRFLMKKGGFCWICLAGRGFWSKMVGDKG